MASDQLEKPLSYYELLEVTQDASDEEIKRAYRRLALKFHPDRPGLHDRRVAEMRFRLINEAYAHVKTQDRRASYNNTLRALNDNTWKNSGFWSQVAAIFKPEKVRQ